MPFVQHWEPAPKNLKLPVLKELPVEATEEASNWEGYKRARIGWLKNFYHCRSCKGWLEGEPNAYSINTLNGATLSGRRGTEHYCKRCGERIGFAGLVS